MICGVDEAGRGPVIGPLVVAAVCVDTDSALRKLQVKDSKRHTPGRREELMKHIDDIASWTVKVVSAEDIDSLRSEMTLNVLEEGLFAAVIDEIAEDGCTVYADAVSTDEIGFGKRVSSLTKKDVKVVAKHKADDIYPVVSAASICAKVRRDREVRDIADEIGQDFGSGYPSDPKTINFLERWVKEHGDLPPHTRHSWKTAERILSKSKNITLDYF